MAAKRTLGELASFHGLSLSVLKGFLKENFSTPGRSFAGGDAGLTKAEVSAIEAAVANGELSQRRALSKEEIEAPPKELGRPISGADLERLPSVEARREVGEASGHASFSVFVHGDVVEVLDRPDSPKNVKKNLTRRIQELMAHGRANKMKGVKGHNAGYLRIPLGGTSGQQYYLWLLNRGEKVKRQDTREFYESFPPKSRLLRAVRHHDDTSKSQVLSIGDVGEYIPFDPKRVIGSPDSEGLSDPLTADQQRISCSGAPIRFIQGQPGAGKTTSLQDVTRHLSGRLLYLTWSTALAERAREWMRLTSPEDLKIEVWTFHEFVSRLDPEVSTARGTPISERLIRLAEGLNNVGGQLGAWWQNGQLLAGELYAELHAHLFGTTLPVDFRGRTAAVDELMPREADYLALRQEQLGGDAAQQAYMAAKMLVREGRVGSLFPELKDAFARARELSAGHLQLDEKEFGFQWVLIDEVQDLTTLEQWLVVDVSARCGAARGVRPGLVIAGDEAQTVRPTAFDWGALNNLVQARFGAGTEIEKHELDTNLRAPHDLALFINRVRSRLYRTINKRQRPSGRKETQPTEATVSRLLQLEIQSDDPLALLRSFAAQPDAAVIYTGDVVPERWREAAQELDTVVWTSEQAKGLEFRVVAVIQAPECVKEIQRLSQEAQKTPLYAELARAAIDRFLVAVSRSNETLVLLSEDWDQEAHSVLSEFVEEDAEGFLGQVSLDGLVELLDLDAADAREQIDQLLTQSRRLQETGDLVAALRLARNAHGLLGTPGRPGAAGEEQRSRVRRQLGVLLAIRALGARDPAPLREAQKTLRLAKRSKAADALICLIHVVDGKVRELDVQRELAELVNGLEGLRDEEPSLVQPVLDLVADHLEHHAEPPRTSMGREVLVHVLEWLATSAPGSRKRFGAARSELLIGILEGLADASTPALVREFTELRARVEEHERLAIIDARHAEATEQYMDAAQRWRALRDGASALRCVRRTGDLREVAAIASEFGSTEMEQIRWSVAVLDLFDRRPSGSMHEDDLRALRAAIEKKLSKASK